MSLPSVVSCTALGTTRGSVGAYASSHSVKKYWLVVLSEAHPDGWLVATQASDVIQPSQRDTTTNWTCVAVSAEPASGDEECVNYIVSSEMRDDPIASTPKAGSSNAVFPWNRCDRIERSSQRYTVPMEQDFTQDNSGVLKPKPVVNSAGDRLVGQITHELFNPYLRIHRSRRVSAFDYQKAQECQGTINSAEIKLYPITQPSGIAIPAGEALLHNVIANDQIWTDPTGSPSTDVPYYDVVIELECKGQYPPGNIDLSDVLVGNTGIHHYAKPNEANTKVHAANKVIDPKWDGTGAVQYLMKGATAAMVPVNAPVYLELDGTRATDLSDDHLATLVKKFKRYARADWSDWAD